VRRTIESGEERFRDAAQYLPEAQKLGAVQMQGAKAIGIAPRLTPARGRAVQAGRFRKDRARSDNTGQAGSGKSVGEDRCFYPGGLQLAQPARSAWAGSRRDKR
jgi:hypothetical protein